MRVVSEGFSWNVDSPTVEDKFDALLFVEYYLCRLLFCASV